jgi:hypothetical protein
MRHVDAAGESGHHRRRHRESRLARGLFDFHARRDWLQIDDQRPVLRLHDRTTDGFDSFAPRIDDAQARRVQPKVTSRAASSFIVADVAD